MAVPSRGVGFPPNGIGGGSGLFMHQPGMFLPLIMLGLPDLIRIAIAITIMIYIVAGKKIYDKRQELRKANERITPEPAPQTRKEKSQEELLPTTNDTQETTPRTATRPGIPPHQKSYASAHHNKQANAALVSYAKVSLLFFCAMMITWIPSTANRIYSLCHPGSVSLPLQYISVAVLPLQGFWNALIYILTSLDACRVFWTSLKEPVVLIGGRGA